MTFNSKGFQPLMALNSALRAILRALARCHSLLFIVILCSLNSLIRTTERTNRGVRVCSFVRCCSVLFGCVRVCSHPRSFGCSLSVFRFQFSVFRSLKKLFKIFWRYENFVYLCSPCVRVFACVRVTNSFLTI